MNEVRLEIKSRRYWKTPELCATEWLTAIRMRTKSRFWGGTMAVEAVHFVKIE